MRASAPEKPTDSHLKSEECRKNCNKMHWIAEHITYWFLVPSPITTDTLNNKKYARCNDLRRTCYLIPFNQATTTAHAWNATAIAIRRALSESDSQSGRGASSFGGRWTLLIAQRQSATLASRVTRACCRGRRNETKIKLKKLNAIYRAIVLFISRLASFAQNISFDHFSGAHYDFMRSYQRAVGQLAARVYFWDTSLLPAISTSQRQ